MRNEEQKDNEVYPKLNILLKIKDKTYHCVRCGSNMFTQLDVDHFQCQACLVKYTTQDN